MTDQHEWPTAPIIQAAWATSLTDWKPSTYIWTRGSDGDYYNTSRGFIARKGEGHFANTTEYWPHDYRKDEVQHLQRALTERKITIAALWKELEAQPDSPCCEPDPTTFVFPPQPDGPVWDRKGRKWEKKGSWWYPDNGHIGCPWSNVLAAYGPLTTTPPDKTTWHVGNKINTPEEADTLPGKTIIHDNRQYYAQKYKNQWFGPGYSDAIEARDFEYPLTIIWRPEETE